MDAQSPLNFDRHEMNIGFYPGTDRYWCMLAFEDERALELIEAVILMHYSGDDGDAAGFLLATSHDAYGTVGLRNLDLKVTQWLRDGPPVVEIRGRDNSGRRRVPLIKANIVCHADDVVQFLSLKARNFLLAYEPDGDYPLPGNPASLTFLKELSAFRLVHIWPRSAPASWRISDHGAVVREHLLSANGITQMPVVVGPAQTPNTGDRQ